jgi:hypothetical protein
MSSEMLSSILTVRSGLGRYETCCANYKLPESLIKKVKTLQTYKTVEEDLDFDIYF